MTRPVYSFRPNLKNPEHQRAWEKFQSVPEGDIILMHDIFPSSVEAALELIDILQKEGYVFVTADELLIE